VKNSVKEDVSLLKSHPGSWDCGGRGGRDARLRRIMNQDEFRVVQSVSLPQAQHPTVEISLCSNEYYDDSLSSITTLRDSCDVSSGSSSPSEYKLTKELGYPFHKWRWGMSKSLYGKANEK
jgi:hypothetical protein